jgi:subtilisin family serine protease
MGAAPVRAAGPAVAPEWQYAAMHANLVPASIQHAASRITIAVVDTGADVSAPDLAAKSPTAWSAISGTPAVADAVGHGTFSLLARRRAPSRTATCSTASAGTRG